MKDQEKQGLRRSAAVQIAAALAGSGKVLDAELGGRAVMLAGQVVSALDYREAVEAKEREAKAQAEAAKKADAPVSQQQSLVQQQPVELGVQQVKL